MHISSIKKELERGDLSYHLLIMIREMLDGLCTAAELLLGVYCWQDSAEDTSMQALAGHKGKEFRLLLNRRREPELHLMCDLHRPPSTVTILGQQGPNG